MDYRVKAGDVGWFDMGVCYQGYLSDYIRTISVGPASDLLKQTLTPYIEKVWPRLVRELRPGAVASVVAQKMCAFREQLGLGPSEGFGHGLGIECHERPFLRAHDHTALEEGVVVVIELDDQYAGPIPAYVESGGVITADGWQSLARRPPGWLEV